MGPPYWPRFCPMGFSNSPHSPKGGSEKKYRARPNRLWGHSKGRLGAPEPHLSGPIPPRIRPERRKPLFWPLGAGTPQRAKKKVATLARNRTPRRGWPGRSPSPCSVALPKQCPPKGTQTYFVSNSLGCETFGSELTK